MSLSFALPLTFQKVFSINFHLIFLLVGFLFKIFINTSKSSKSREGVTNVSIAENSNLKFGMFGIKNFSDKHFHPYICTAGHCSLPRLCFCLFVCFVGAVCLFVCLFLNENYMPAPLFCLSNKQESDWKGAQLIGNVHLCYIVFSGCPTHK